MSTRRTNLQPPHRPRKPLPLRVLPDRCDVLLPGVGRRVCGNPWPVSVTFAEGECQRSLGLWHSSRAPPAGGNFVYAPRGHSQADFDELRELTYVDEDTFWSEFRLPQRPKGAGGDGPWCVAGFARHTRRVSTPSGRQVLPHPLAVTIISGMGNQISYHYIPYHYFTSLLSAWYAT